MRTNAIKMKLFSWLIWKMETRSLILVTKNRKDDVMSGEETMKMILCAWEVNML